MKPALPRARCRALLQEALRIIEIRKLTRKQFCGELNKYLNDSDQVRTQTVFQWLSAVDDSNPSGESILAIQAWIADQTNTKAQPKQK